MANIYDATFTPDGNGNWTVAVRKNGTSASGGTTITGVGVDDTSVLQKNIRMATEMAQRILISDNS